MVAATAAWDGSAAELNSASAAFRSVVSGRTGGPWLGWGAQPGEKPLSAGVRDELNDLRRQVVELAMERDVLMHAAALWAREAMAP
jgi:hypothetical protein